MILLADVIRPPRSAQDAIRREFDRKAPRYEAGRLATWYQAQGELALSHLRRGGHTPTPLLLDVGCGTGWLLRRWVSTERGRRGVGVDLSPGMVECAHGLAEAEGVEGLRFVAGDWEDEDTPETVRSTLPLPAGAVTCISAFHYFSRPETALRRMVSLLAPGGTLLLLDRAVDQAPMTLVWDFLHRAVIADHVRFHRTEGLLALMRRAGLENVRVDCRVRRLFWKGKLETSLVLLSGRRSLGDGARILEDP